MLPNPPCRAPRGGASHVPFLSYRYALSRILSSENGQNREFLTRFVNAIWANWHNGHLDRLPNLRAKDIRFRHNVSPDQSTLVVLLKTSTETSRGKTTLAVCRQFFCCVTSRRAVDQSRISVSKQRFLFLRTKRRQLELAWSRWFLLEFRRQRGGSVWKSRSQRWLANGFWIQSRRFLWKLWLNPQSRQQSEQCDDRAIGHNNERNSRHDLRSNVTSLCNERHSCRWRRSVVAPVATDQRDTAVFAIVSTRAEYARSTKKDCERERQTRTCVHGF